MNKTIQILLLSFIIASIVVPIAMLFVTAPWPPMVKLGTLAWFGCFSFAAWYMSKHS